MIRDHWRSASWNAQVAPGVGNTQGVQIHSQKHPCFFMQQVHNVAWRIFPQKSRCAVEQVMRHSNPTKKNVCIICQLINILMWWAMPYSTVTDWHSQILAPMHSQLPLQGDHKETRLDEDVQLDWKGQGAGWGFLGAQRINRKCCAMVGRDRERISGCLHEVSRAATPG